MHHLGFPVFRLWEPWPHCLILDCALPCNWRDEGALGCAPRRSVFVLRVDCRQLVLSEGETLPLLSFSFDISVFLAVGMVRSSEGGRQGMKPKRLLSQLNLQLMIPLSSSVLRSPSYLSYSAPQNVTSAAACMPRVPPASGPGRHFLMLPRQGMGLLLSQLCAILCLPGPHRDSEPLTCQEGAPSTSGPASPL